MSNKMMEALKKRRATIKGQMTKILTYAESIKADTNHEEIKARLDKTNHLWSEFSNIEGQMFEIDTEVESQTNTFDDMYYHAVALLNGAIRLFHANQVNTTTNSGELSFQATTMETRLPKLYIPVFCGDYQDWQSFFDLFNSAVHEKTSLSAAQKLQYLKGLLKGEPLGLVRHLSATDANYIEAYQILCKRYDKKKATINSYIDSFFQIPALSRVNSANVRKLANTTEEIIRGLKAIGPQGEARDPWLIYILVSKLDDESRQLWQHQASKIEHPTFQDVIDCLLIRADSLEGIREVVCKPTPQRTSIIRRSHSAIPTNALICPLCKTEHLLFQCPNFKKMSTSERRAYIQKTSRCYNCLSDNHAVLSCRSKRSCYICRKRHNSLLHVPNSYDSSTSAHSVNTINLASSETPISTLPTSVNTSSLSNFNPTTLNTSQHSSFNNSPPTITNSTFNTPQHSSFNNSVLNIPKSTINIPAMTTTVLDVPPTNLFTSTQVQAADHPHSNHVTNNRETSRSSESAIPYCQALLPTALVFAKNAFGDMLPCRVLLDSGSQASFVTESFSKRLSLPTRRANVKITGVGSSTAGIAKRVTSLDVYSRFQTNHRLTVQALILPQIAMPLPSASFYLKDWDHLNQLQLADPNFNETSNIDLLIGSDHFFDIITDGKKTGSVGTPIAQNSIFGWIIVGNITADDQKRSPAVTLMSEVDTNWFLQKFWETEEAPITHRKHLTEEEQLCESHFEETHSRSSDGRFVVRLPFKPNRRELGNSFNSARRRFSFLENRLQSHPNIKEPYIAFMREYIALGHMKLIPPEDHDIDHTKAYYLPHHAVFKESSTTTKLRVVFDASSKTSNGVSLNNTLLVGPTVQNSLYSILLRFRKHVIVFAADIEKMYRQIHIHHQDTDYQRICWRENPSLPMKYYRLMTVTYGTASAPYLATKTLIKLADEYLNQYPTAAKVIKEDLYVDDLMSGSNTEQEALHLKDKLIEILAAAKLPLRKWTSNCPSLLNTIPPEWLRFS